MAGLSHGLSRLNEVVLPQLAKELGGEKIVAGGGKFTARFHDADAAQHFRNEAVREVSTRFPMLEFQVSPTPVQANQLADIPRDPPEKSLIGPLSEAKIAFRGSALTFNPHLAVCDECGEYPAVVPHPDKKSREKNERVCRICQRAYFEARFDVNSEDQLVTAIALDIQGTTLAKVYRRYMELVGSTALQIPLNFSNLLGGDEQDADDQTQRMAVWISDINGLGDKVSTWLSQADTEIVSIFDHVSSLFVDTVAQALAQTFGAPKEGYLPFRLIVAGGDDLCLVMEESFALRFAEKIDSAVKENREQFESDPNNKLSRDWLKAHPPKRQDFAGKPSEPPDFKPYGFGAALLVTSLHVPFYKLHEHGEHLLKAAKEATKREDNAMTWDILTETPDARQATALPADKPLFLSLPKDGKRSLVDYLTSSSQYSFSKVAGLATSQIYALTSKLDELYRCHEDADQGLTRWLKIREKGATVRGTSVFLYPPFSDQWQGTQVVSASRVVAALELASLKQFNTEDGQ